AMAMGHVILKETWADRQVPRFADYARRFTDLPYLVRLERADGGWRAGRLLRASDLGGEEEHADWKPVVWDDGPRVPKGSAGHRWDGEDGDWNLRLDGIQPALSLIDDADETVELELPAHDRVLRRGVPAKRVGGHLVTTVLDLLLASYGVARHGLPGEWPFGYDDDLPYTPAWQERITGVPRAQCIRVARELAENAERSGGRSMIVLGAGVNHWYHGDTAYRAILALLLLTGCQGVNGGGWAHYVGQEKVRPVTGLSQVAFALDWAKPPRHQAATPFWYLATDQWRYDELDTGSLLSPLARREGRHVADEHALAARLGWLPSYPQFDRTSLDLEPEEAVARLRAGSLRFACEDPDAPQNWPRVLLLWRANLLGASSKGHEYFLRHLLGTDSAATAPEAERRPEDVVWHDAAPEGKLDLLVTLDFRMSGSALYSDVVLPAATWYEKEDISSTDMHPFVHPFQAAVPPQWESKPDWDIFTGLAQTFSELAGPRLGVRRDLVAAPLLHDSPDELAQSEVRDWRAGECEAVPGKTMPKLVVVERDYGAVHERMTTLGPLVAQGVAAKGISWKPQLDGLGRLETARDACETILALSGTTNGAAAYASWRDLERQTGSQLTDLVAGHETERIAFHDLVERPRRVFTSPEWSGIESGGRRYSPFTLNVERDVPWRTLTGRQQLYADHEWMRDYGEALPVYRPPLDLPGPEGGLVLRYLTPHSKWSVHSTYGDVLTLLTLFRGGPTIWLAPGDAAQEGIADNDWVECANANGALRARAVVSHRIPAGVAVVYHAQDRHVGAPRDSGTHNSPTRIHMKPTHMIGGYAQLSYGFNYYGPIGAQRDELCSVRRLEEVSWS
ncbi:MAG: molybdopterin-dependent oxidoreductase, partial [Gaiellaceae bacterium]